MLSLHRAVRSELCRFTTTACFSRRFPLPFCYLKKMNTAQKSTDSSSGYSSITAEKPFGNKSSVEEARQSSVATIINEKESQSRYEKNFPSLSVNSGSSSKVGKFGKRRKRVDLGSALSQEAVNSFEFEGTANVASLQEEHSLLNSSRTRIDYGWQPMLGTVDSSEDEGIVSIASLQEEHSLPCAFGKKKVLGRYVRQPPFSESKSNKAVGTKISDRSGVLPRVERFNICQPRFRDIETKEVLRPGMILLKHYISLREQINIVRTCNALGEGPGGFYRPGYKDGAKLRLNMMCLGLNWDPQTRQYDKRHPVDNCEPPNIPLEFRILVERAIQDAHCLIKKDSDIVNPEDVLPSMSPNICIVNFYNMHGRLGLHQDRDESEESLRKGLPVVSLSIGDSAEFLFGDGREVDLAEKVILESGDVLLFGGESRMVFHGVQSIIPFSAPRPLLAETGLRHGRLNLTFRQY